MTPKKPEEITMEIEKAVHKAVHAIKNGNGMPKTWMELIWMSSKTFGVPVIFLGVILLVFYQTFPKWVEANIETQHSLTKNLDQQSTNIENQTENIKKQSSTLDDLSETVAEIVKCEGEMTTQHVQQCAEHKAMVETLGMISQDLKKKGDGG